MSFSNTLPQAHWAVNWYFAASNGGGSDPAVNPPHALVIRVVIRVVRNEGLIENLEILHIRDGPQLSETVSTGGAEAATLNCPEDLDTPRGHTMAVWRHDATATVILERQ